MSILLQALREAGRPIPESIDLVRRWIRLELGLDPQVLISVNELSCSDAGCIPRKTVVLLMVQRQVLAQFEIHKALRDVEADDIRLVCARPLVA